MERLCELARHQAPRAGRCRRLLDRYGPGPEPRLTRSAPPGREAGHAEHDVPDGEDDTEVDVLLPFGRVMHPVVGGTHEEAARCAAYDQRTLVCGSVPKQT